MSHHTILTDEYLEPTSLIYAPQPWLTFHVPFPAAQPNSPLPPSSPVHRQEPEMFQDPNEINIPLRSISISPEYLSPTIKEIESLTLDSGPRYDMADYVIDNVYACTLWDNFQQDLYNARRLEGMAREHCWGAAIQWERF